MPTGDVTKKPRELYVLTRNGYVMTEKQELWSDSLDYYRESGHALLFRNIQIDDAEHKVLAFGDYGEYWKEPGNALLTQRPSVVSYDTSQSDSLYMCADSMFLYTISKSEQARADSLAKVKAKAAALAADSLAGSKGGPSVDSLAAKPSALRVQKPRRMDRRRMPLLRRLRPEPSKPRPKLRMPVLVPLQNP